MRKFFCIIYVIYFSVFYANADFNKSYINYQYNRKMAVKYMDKYYNNHNDDYYNYTNIGGNCTNYASQILHYAGIPFSKIVTNPTYKNWYYFGPNYPNQRTATWTGATLFRKYFGDIGGIGQKVAKSMKTYTISGAIDNFSEIVLKVLPGDIISHGHNLDTSYHTQIIYEVDYSNNDVIVSQNTSNSKSISLFEYLKLRELNNQGDEFIFVICF